MAYRGNARLTAFLTAVIITFLLLSAGAGPVGRRDVLVVAIPGDPGSLDATRVPGTARGTLTSLIDWGWTKYAVKETDGRRVADVTKLMPGVVTGWSVEKLPDGKARYTAKIRQGAKFHSGNEVTSEDLRWNILRYCGLRQNYLEVVLAGISQNCAEAERDITTPDRYTLQVVSRRPMPLFEFLWAGRTYFDTKMIQSLNPTKDDPWATSVIAKNDVYSGPYKLKAWKPGVEVVYERFEDYWGPKPYFSEIVYRVVPDVSTRVLLLKRGEVDIAEGIGMKDALDLKRDRNVQVISPPSAEQIMVGMNVNIPPFNNKALRKALNWAFPYDDVIKTALFAQARRANGSIPNGFLAARTKPFYNMDLERAKALLAEAGFPGGRGLELELNWSEQFPDHERIAALFQANLRSLGVNVRLRQIPVGEYAKNFREGKIAFGIHQGIGFVWDSGYVLSVWHLSTSFVSPSRIDSRRLDDLIMRSLEETNRTRRVALLTAAENLLIEEAPVIFVAQPNYLITMRADLKGYVFQPTQYTLVHLLSR